MIRPAQLADAEGIARVHVTAWAETYAGLVPAEALATRTVEARTAFWHGLLSADPPSPHRAEVAVLDLAGTVAGFASWGEQRDASLLEQGFDGEVSSLYLVRSAQGRGHGRALMAQAARGLLARGHRGASLWVLRDNPRARAFYDRLGGRIVSEGEDDLAGVPVVTVCYAWPALDRLLVSPARPGVGSSQKWQVARCCGPVS